MGVTVASLSAAEVVAERFKDSVMRVYAAIRGRPDIMAQLGVPMCAYADPAHPPSADVEPFDQKPEDPELTYLRSATDYVAKAFAKSGVLIRYRIVAAEDMRNLEEPTTGAVLLIGEVCFVSTAPKL